MKSKTFELMNGNNRRFALTFAKKVNGDVERYDKMMIKKKEIELSENMKMVKSNPIMVTCYKVIY